MMITSIMCVFSLFDWNLFVSWKRRRGREDLKEEKEYSRSQWSWMSRVREKVENRRKILFSPFLQLFYLKRRQVSLKSILYYYSISIILLYLRENERRRRLLVVDAKKRRMLSVVDVGIRIIIILKNITCENTTLVKSSVQRVRWRWGWLFDATGENGDADAHRRHHSGW